MHINEQIEQERPYRAQARELALRYGQPFTLFRDGDRLYLRCSTPANDPEAQRQGWQWVSVTYPPKGA